MPGKIKLLAVLMFLALTGFLFWDPDVEHPETKGGPTVPSDWFYMQRAWPNGEINDQAWQDAFEQHTRLRQDMADGLPVWEPAGPTNVGGRITGLAVDPNRFDTFYAATATGGVFKTTDAGASWLPIFDEFATLSIGAIAMDPNNPNTLFVGTGEANGGGGSVSYGGSGIYKTTDGGASWTHLGLPDSHHIGRIVIDPLNPQNIFVAVVGKLWNTNGERGVYRSSDGGANWEQVLFVSNQAGAVDVAINPLNPDVLYAAIWERLRGPDFRDYGGTDCGLWRSIDGGDTWQELTNGLPNNILENGRIGVSVSASNPNVVYAIYADNIGFFAGVYRSNDAGDSWTRTTDSSLTNLYSSFGWWFGNIRVDPNDSEVAYVMGLNVYRTVTGGASWTFRSGGMHVDQHALYVHPLDSNWILAGNDGGVYLSQDAGSSYTHLNNLPITQFYTSEIDYQNPESIYGGTQDNGTNRTLTGALNDWQRIYGGDGFYVKVDYTNNSYVYAESQRGGLARSTNGGASFFSALNGINGNDRNNWNSPLAMDPNNPEILYFGTDRVYKTTNRAQSWTAISDDLTNGPGLGNLTFGTVTTIDVAPTDGDVIYVGTDDGNVWITVDGGANWMPRLAGIPQRWVTRVTVAPNDAQTAFITLSGFRYDQYQPHIMRTTNGGANWHDISTNLPEAPLNDILVDPEDPNRLWVAGDLGVYTADQPGADWEILGTGMPVVPVTDLTFHNPTRTLVAGTYGRSMYKIGVGFNCATPDDYTNALVAWGQSTSVLDIISILADQCPSSL